MNKNINLLIICMLLTFVFSMHANAQATDDIYIIGVVEPLNKTELPGHIPFPYFGEVMYDDLTSSSNNYIIKMINDEDLEEVGYRFSSLKPDSDLQPGQIKKLCENHRLDAILTGKIKVVDYELIPRFMSEAGRATTFEIEGILYGRDGNQIWADTVKKDYEFTRDKGKFVPPYKTQLVNLYASECRTLANSLTGKIGTKPQDRQPPVIEFENIKSGDDVKSTCIILKGKVTDNSKVDSIIVNGQDFPVKAPSKEVEMFYPVQIPDGVKGQKVLVTIEAKDIYGYTYAKQLNLTWATPIKGLVSSINPETISIKFSSADFGRVNTGIGFYVYSIDEFRDPLSSHRMRMFTAVKTGPVVVTKRYPNKNVVHAQFLRGHEALMGQVKKNDIAK